MIHILIVDDHPEIRRSIEQLLSLEPDFEVAGIACDGLEAIDQARSLRPDVIIMDYRMPCMDGFTAAQRIQDEQPGIAVIILALHDEQELFSMAGDTGIWRHLAKPVNAEELSNAIWSVLA